MDFALIGLIIVVGFLLAVIWPHPEIKANRKREIAQEPERPAVDVPSSSPDPSASASHPSTRAA